MTSVTGQEAGGDETRQVGKDTVPCCGSSPGTGSHSWVPASSHAVGFTLRCVTRAAVLGVSVKSTIQEEGSQTGHECGSPGKR